MPRPHTPPTSPPEPDGETENTNTQANAPRCHRCGYILTGLSPTGRCPECGEPIGGYQRGKTRYIRFAERSPDMIRRVRLAALLAILAWAGGVTLWVSAYYINLSHWLIVGPAVVSICAPLVAFFLTQDDLGFAHDNFAQALAFSRWFQAAALAAPILTAVTLTVVLARPAWTNAIILLSWPTAWLWVVVQVLACFGFSRIARAAEDDTLAAHLMGMAKALVIIVVAMSPIQAIMQWMSVRMGVMPVFCLPCYLLPLAFLIGQVFFCLCMLRIMRLMKWSLVYQSRLDAKHERLRERMGRAARNNARSTRLDRD